MARIHITLIGGQKMPVYIGINDAPPDKVVLIYSMESRENMDGIKNSIGIETDMVLLDPVDYPKIMLAAKKCFDKYVADRNEVTVNITSGTKVWSIVFFSVFSRNQQVKIQYVDQNCIIYDLLHQEQHTSTLQLSTNDIFDYNGQHPKSYKLIGDYNEDDLRSLKIIKEIRKFNFNEFKELTIIIPKDIFDKNMQGEYRSENQSRISWNKETSTVKITLTKKNINPISRIIHSKHTIDMVFHSGWFEFEVAHILARWKYTIEVWLNVRFPYNKTGQDKNEVDVIVNTGTKLLFVECKTQIFHQTDIDKFRTVIKNYGGMGCKSIFITQAPIKEEVREKCSDSGILTFSIDESLQWGTEKSLFLLLEQDLFHINTK